MYAEIFVMYYMYGSVWAIPNYASLNIYTNFDCSIMQC